MSGRVQAQGKDSVRTSDVWAFGCVLYEMLTGSRAFDGATVSEIVAGVLKSQPDWKRRPDAVLLALFVTLIEQLIWR